MSSRWFCWPADHKSAGLTTCLHQEYTAIQLLCPNTACRLLGFIEVLDSDVNLAAYVVVLTGHAGLQRHSVRSYRSCWCIYSAGLQLSVLVFSDASGSLRASILREGVESIFAYSGYDVDRESSETIAAGPYCEWYCIPAHRPRMRERTFPQSIASMVSACWC